MLIGKIGQAKSCTGNIFIGANRFGSGDGINGITTHFGVATINDNKIIVIDTPGFKSR